MKSKLSERIIELADRDCQPKQAELKETIRLDVPGSSIAEKMENFGRALRPAKIQYVPKPRK